MASSAPTVAEEERFDSPDDLSRKVDQLVSLITKSKHFIVFTGAGVSTSAGIADFRGPAGVWTLRAQGQESKIRSLSTLNAIPTPTHMALVALQDANIMAHLVSQNCDGLHRRSGILPSRISELHGNSNLEVCRAEGCGREYLRDFRAVASYEKSVHDHRTGRKCDPVCGGNLYDTIINFGEHLPEKPLADARAHAAKADLVLVLGSSLTVPPACTIPEITAKRRFGKGKMVICNLQSTPLDNLAALRVWAKADDLMVRVMEKLGIEVPGFVLRRRLVVEVYSQDAEMHAVMLRGVDVDGTPVTFMRSVKMVGTRRAAKTEPFTINWRGKLQPGDSIELEVEFMGHYGEPNLTIRHVHSGTTGYLLAYDPSAGEWKVERGDVV